MAPILKSKTSFRSMRAIFFFSLIAILGALVGYIVLPFFYPIFWAAVIAGVFYPLYSWLEKYIRIRPISSILTILIVCAVLFLPLFFIGALLVNESVSLYKQFSSGNVITQFRATTDWLTSTPVAPFINDFRDQTVSLLSNGGQAVAAFIFQNLRGVTEGSIRFVVMFAIMLYTLYYFFMDGPHMLKRLAHLSPLGDKYETLLYNRFTSTARATLKGTIIIGAIQGLLTGLLFWATGIQSPIIWSVITAIVAILPAMGPPMVIIPAGIIQFFLGNGWQSVVLLAGAFIISFIDNILRPPLVGHDIQMHPVLVLFTTLGGLLIFGVSGFIIGPIIAALFLSILNIYDEYYQDQLNNN